MGKWQIHAKKMRKLLPPLRNWLRSLRIRHVNLPLAMLFSLAGAVVIATFAAWVLAPQLNVGTQRTSPADLTRIALTIAAGVGGVVALVVAYRRQRDLEQSRFVEAFGAAAKQLGDSDVAVRLAGVYAMAAVADQASKLKRQQCIDVLCGYLRLPYSPELGNNHQSTLVVKKPVLRKGGPEQEAQFQYRQNDKVVRQTIVRVIAAHLQKKAPHSWSSHSFDFAGVYFEEPDFSSVIFNGRNTSFEAATFNGRNTLFEAAIFNGEVTSFDLASFSADLTLLSAATFSSETTSFIRTTFSGDHTWFIGSTFSSESTSFVGAIFRGEFTAFTRATFSGNDISFLGATFSGLNTMFDQTTFNAENTVFEQAIFRCDLTTFQGATFSGGRTQFLGADFGTGAVSFRNPRMWSPAPIFDWDTGTNVDSFAPKPVNVTPQNWPPVVATRTRG